MSTELTWSTNSINLDETLAVAFEIGRQLKGGEVIELVSDLGGGKTTFVKGLAQGMGSKDEVHSPSFTISNEYKTKDLTLFHFDFYRLSEAGIMQSELNEMLEDDQAVVVVEWANIVEDALPAERLTVRLKVTGETTRCLEFKYPKNLNYLFPINT